MRAPDETASSGLPGAKTGPCPGLVPHGPGVVREETLSYFDTRKSSGPVEGGNSKVRVVVNRARDMAGPALGRLRERVAGFRAIFSGACS
jgi:hypothetical protein